jgi:hypothetical protein
MPRIGQRGGLRPAGPGQACGLFQQRRRLRPGREPGLVAGEIVEGTGRAGQDFAREDWDRLLAGTAPVSPHDAPILTTIADVLEVAVEYFVRPASDAADPVDAELDFLATMRDTGSFFRACTRDGAAGPTDTKTLRAITAIIREYRPA